MTCAEHLIENAIYALRRGEDFKYDVNAEYTHCTVDEAKAMASHIIFGLYNGVFPDELD